MAMKRTNINLREDQRTKLGKLSVITGATMLISRRGFEEGTELARAGGVPQLAERLGFDLADTLAGEGERLAHFLERVLAAVVQPEAHLDDLFLTRGEGLQY